jgi:hypothetical protein
MFQYRVSFFKDLLNSSGHNFRCLQGQIVVRASPGPTHAIACAEREFATLNCVNDWKLLADSVEVVADNRGALPN